MPGTRRNSRNSGELETWNLELETYFHGSFYMKSRKWLSVAITVLSLSLSGIIFTAVGASSTGRVGFSGNPNTNGGFICNVCHSGGVVPAVSLDGPTAVTAGETVTYTLTISGGQEVAGGFNVSTTGGNLTIVPGTTDTQIMSGELTHTAPKPVDSNLDVVFTFRWTAPGTTGNVRLYGAGNSVNLDLNSTGDAPATDTLDIVVQAPTSVSLTGMGGHAAATDLLIWLIPVGGILLILALAALRYRAPLIRPHR